MRKPCAILTLISMLFSMPFAAPIARADDHLVARGAVNQRLADAATERARNLASLEGLLASPRAGRARPPRSRESTSTASGGHCPS